ncbi:MAG: CvpA family protein [Pseudomonadota bacterium]
MDLGGLDIAVAAILILSAIIAFIRGFVTEVLALAAWGGAAFATIFLYQPLSAWANSWIDIEWLSIAAAIAFLFFFSITLLRLITSKIGSMVKSSKLGFADRSLGAAFGVLRGFGMICFAFLIYTLLVQPKEAPSWIVEASTGESVVQGSSLLAKVIYGGKGGESAAEILDRFKKRAQDIAVKATLENMGYGDADRKRLDSLTEDVAADE